MFTKNIHRASFNVYIRTILLAVALISGIKLNAQITYTRKDSLKIISLLKDGLKYKKSNHNNNLLMLYYGHKLVGVPYVAHTLEVNPKEQLVINTRQLDCTTFTETVLALARTTIRGSIKWDDYCHNLRMIRYENGILCGYPSRNHYFLWWVESNIRQDIVSIPQCNEKLCQRQKIFLNWMTTHTSDYTMLRGNAQFVSSIKNHERESNGKRMTYIPKEKLDLTKDKLYWVKDGDILAICTNKKGLDTTHIGIAEWGSDGKLHLLNASQIHKKVILEPKSLYEYMKQHPIQIGVWVIRPIL